MSKRLDVKEMGDMIRKYAADNNIPIVEIKCSKSSFPDWLGSPLSQKDVKVIGENLIADLMDKMGRTNFLNLHNKLVSMSVVDDGKRYNVWNVEQNRWTNSGVDGKMQDPSNPAPLNYDKAKDLLKILMSFGHDIGSYEIRELTTTKAATIQPSSVKSSGMKCKKCQDFNSYAEPNQSDGSFCCFGCR
jgi:hypothetical protein